MVPQWVCDHHFIFYFLENSNEKMNEGVKGDDNHDKPGWWVMNYIFRN